jgi:DNA-binding Xre family transcriptional regulator
MKITEERLGFLNMRLVQRMNEVGVSATQLAHSVSLTYEQVRKLVMGRCLPSDSTLERLCASLDLNKRDMKQRVAKDKMIFRSGDAAWAYWDQSEGCPALHLFSIAHQGRAGNFQIADHSFCGGEKEKREATDRVRCMNAGNC